MRTQPPELQVFRDVIEDLRAVVAVCRAHPSARARPRPRFECPSITPQLRPKPVRPVRERSYIQNPAATCFPPM